VALLERLRKAPRTAVAERRLTEGDFAVGDDTNPTPPLSPSSRQSSPTPPESPEHAKDGPAHSEGLTRYLASGDDDSVNGKWHYHADDVSGKGYDVDATRLEKIAASMEDDLRDLETALGKFAAMTPLTTEHVGQTEAGREFVRLAATAHQGFAAYYRELQDAYRLVITNLYRSAGEYKKAEAHRPPNR
jgi:hypothetical protein